MAKKNTYDASSITVLEAWKLCESVPECISEVFPARV